MHTLIHYTKANLYRTSRVLPSGVEVTIDLKPGMNSIPSSTWDALCGEEYTHPGIAQLISDGAIEICQRIETVESSGGIDYRSIGVADARRMIKATYDAAMVDAWTKVETREPVLAALRKQAELIQLARANMQPKDAGEIAS